MVQSSVIISLVHSQLQYVTVVLWFLVFRDDPGRPVGGVRSRSPLETLTLTQLPIRISEVGGGLRR